MQQVANKPLYSKTVSKKKDRFRLLKKKKEKDRKKKISESPGLIKLAAWHIVASLSSFRYLSRKQIYAVCVYVKREGE